MNRDLRQACAIELRNHLIRVADLRYVGIDYCFGLKRGFEFGAGPSYNHTKNTLF